MGTTTNNQLPYPEPATTVDIPRDIKALAVSVDAMFPQVPVLRLRRTTPFAVASSSTPTVIPFNVKDEDPAGMSNATGDAITVKTSGVWSITAGIIWNPDSAVGNRLMEFRVNGAPRACTTGAGLTSTWAPGHNLAVLARLAVNDIVTFGAAQNSGVAVNIGTGYPPFLMMVWLRP